MRLKRIMRIWCASANIGAWPSLVRIPQSVNIYTEEKLPICNEILVKLAEFLRNNCAVWGSTQYFAIIYVKLIGFFGKKEWRQPHCSSEPEKTITYLSPSMAWWISARLSSFWFQPFLSITVGEINSSSTSISQLYLNWGKMQTKKKKKNETCLSGIPGSDN